MIAAALSVLRIRTPPELVIHVSIRNVIFQSRVKKYKSDNYQGAIADYTKVLEIDPQNTFACDNRGLAKGYLKDLPGAIGDDTKAQENNFSLSMPIIIVALPSIT